MGLFRTAKYFFMLCALILLRLSAYGACTEVTPGEFLCDSEVDEAQTTDLIGTLLTKTGPGTLTLMTANPFSGLANINAGGIIADTDVFTGDSFVAGPPSEDEDGAFFAFMQDTDGTFAGSISGGGEFIKDGAGVITLTGSNTVQTTDIYDGALSISSGSNLSGDINMIGGELQVTNDVTLGAITPQNIYLDNDITVNKGFNVSGGATLTFGGGVTLGGEGSLYKDGAGTLFLNQNYSDGNYSGNTFVRGGVLEIIDGGVLGSDGSILALNSGTLLVDQSTTIDRQISFQNNSTSVNIADGAEVLLTQNTRGVGAFNKDGDGTLTMTGGTMTQTGGTFINAGILQGDSNSLAGTITDGATLNFLQNCDGTFLGTLAGAGVVNKYGSGVLGLTGAYTNFNGSFNVLDGAVSGNTDNLVTDIYAASGAQVIFNQNFDGEYSNVIYGAGGIVKTGTNVLKLSGVNTYTGDTVIADAAGILIDSDTALGGPGSKVVLEGGNLSLDSGVTLSTLRDFILGAGPNYITALDGAEYTINGTISGTSFVKLGNGTIILGGDNTYSQGTQISQGTLAAASTSALGTGLLAITGGTFKPLADMEIDSNVYINGLAGFDVGNGITLSTAGYVYGGGTIHKLGAGTLQMGQYNSYIGGMQIDEGTVIGDADSILGDVSINGSGVLDFQQDYDGYFVGNINAAPAASVNKNGAGMLVMEGDTTNGNTLNVGNFNINEGAAISFGILNGNINVGTDTSLFLMENGGGTLNSAGDVYIDSTRGINFDGDINLNDGAKLVMGVTEGESAKLSVTGALNAAAGSSLALQADGVFKTAQTFEIIDYGGIFTNNFNGVTVENNQRLVATLDDSVAGIISVTITRLLTNYSALVGLNYNQTQVAAAFDRASAAPSPDMESVLNKIDALSPAGRREALTQAGGLIYANIFKLNSFKMLRDNAYLRMNAKEEGNNIWAQAAGNYYDAKPNENSGKLYNFSSGLVFGFDKRYNSGARLGFAGSYMRHDLKHNGMENLDGDEYQAGGYFIAGGEKFDLKSSLTAGYRTSYVTRNISFAGRRAKGNVRSYGLNADAEAGFNAGDVGIFTLRPFAGLSAAAEQISSFQESGAGDLDLSFDGATGFYADARAGLGIQKTGALSYYIDGVLRQNLTQPETRLVMAGENFTLRPEGGKMSYGARAGIGKKFSDLLSLYADGGADFASSSRNFYLNIGVRSYW